MKRVLICHRDAQGDWYVGYDAKVIAETFDGTAMKVKRAWWSEAKWFPVKGIGTRLQTLLRKVT